MFGGSRTKRIEREIEKGYESVQFEFLDDKNGLFGEIGNCYIRFWQNDGRYAGQIHIIQIKFVYGTNTVYKFPLKPPNVSFITPIYHANIYQGGAICLDILKEEKWSPMQDIDSVFASLQLLLVEPNPSSPAHGAAGSDYKNLSPTDFAKKSMSYYLKTILEKQGNKDGTQILPLLKTDAFKSGIIDITYRDDYRANILAQLN